MSRRAKIQESVKSVVKDKPIRALCTHEVVEGIIDSFNKVCPRKVMKELSKAEAAQSGCSSDFTNANRSRRGSGRPWHARCTTTSSAKPYARPS